MSHEGFHEAPEELTSLTKDLHRALVSLQEELEAVDWYQQRVDASPDEALQAILAHNRDEEIEHAIMTLEWIRRRVPKFDEHMKTYLFTKAPVTEVEDEVEHGGEKADAGERERGGKKREEARGASSAKAQGSSLGIGSLVTSRKGR